MNELYYNSLKKNYNIRRVKINYSSSIDEIGKLNVAKFFGVFVVFLNSGREILYGKRSHWEMFKYTYMPDNDYLIKN